MNITREIITDLWPAYAAGKASSDTRALIEEFMQEDPEFGRVLRETSADQTDVRKLSPEREAQASRRARHVLQGGNALFFLAMLFSGFAFGRIISDTSWDVSPRRFIITAIIAGLFWVAWCWRTIWIQRRALKHPGLSH